MTIKITKDDRFQGRINGKVKELFEKNGITAQQIVDWFIEEHVVFVIDPKTNEVLPKNKKTQTKKKLSKDAEKLLRHIKRTVHPDGK